MPARLSAFTMIALTTLSTLLLAGCGGSGSDAKYLVIFCQANNAEPYRAAQNERFEELFGERDDVKLVIYDAAKNGTKQVEQIEQAIKQQPDLLIVAPLNNATPNKPMEKAQEAGIKVICLERNTTGKHYDTFIGCDNKAIGRMAGEFIVKALTEKHGEPKGKLIELKGSEIQAMNDRHDGAFEVLQPHIDAGKIEVVHTATANWAKTEARAKMTEAYNATEGDFDVIYAHNDPMAHGAYLVIKGKNEQAAKDAIIVGIDGLAEEGVKWVEAGDLDATFEYPLCVDKAVEIGMKMIEDPDFKPEATYILDSRPITGK